MIIVGLKGGLGNQMFQYAAARRLAQVNGAKLKIDVGWFDDASQVHTQRGFELGAFALVANFATSDEVRRLRGPDIRRWPHLVKQLLLACGYKGPPSHIVERHYHFDPEVLAWRGDAYLDGYWQSEKYFADLAGAIRNDFAVVPKPDDVNRKLLDVIRGCMAVSIHVRRGDYINNMVTAEYHGLTPPAYYEAAVDMMRRRVSTAHFFVFSDDPAWVKENFNYAVPMTFIDYNGPDKGYEDLRLMAACRHHIIANSSFSWWGAWLGDNPEKIVIAPQRWFNQGEIDSSDLLPESWLRL